MTIVHVLPCGRKTLVDEQDEVHLQAHNWSARRSDQVAEKYYVQCRLGGVTIYLHRLILGQPALRSVDHRNGDGLDNRRLNLRVGTTGQNNANRSYPPSRSGFRGVEIVKDGYRAHISGGPRTGSARRKIHLGVFPTVEEAARAYDDAARDRWGEFARLNFPRAA